VRSVAEMTNMDEKTAKRRLKDEFVVLEKTSPAVLFKRYNLVAKQR